jgi:hypothetical protein
MDLKTLRCEGSDYPDQHRATFAEELLEIHGRVRRIGSRKAYVGNEVARLPWSELDADLVAALQRTRAARARADLPTTRSKQSVDKPWEIAIRAPRSETSRISHVCSAPFSLTRADDTLASRGSERLYTFRARAAEGPLTRTSDGPVTTPFQPRATPRAV